MRIAVLAANGRSGQAFVRAALAAGHQVRAGVHSHNPFSDQKGLWVITCDALNPKDLARLVEGEDAVVSFIGHVRGSAADVQTRAVEQLIPVMKKARVERLVSLTGTGVRFDGDKITLLDRILNFAVSVIDPARVKDGKDHVRVIEQSKLDWTVIRVLKLMNWPARPFTLTASGPAKTFVSRDEVAQAALEVLEKQSFSRQAPIISRP